MTGSISAQSKFINVNFSDELDERSISELIISKNGEKIETTNTISTDCKGIKVEFNTLGEGNYVISFEKLRDSEGKAIGVPGITTPDEIIDWVESLGSDWFNFCVDTGHAAITGVEPEKLIEALNNKQLTALHVHDNNLNSDQHLLPYQGSLDWDNITAALRKIDYKGDFTLESTNFFARVPDEFVPEALKYAEKTGRLLIDKILTA